MSGQPRNRLVGINLQFICFFLPTIFTSLYSEHCFTKLYSCVCFVFYIAVTHLIQLYGYFKSPAFDLSLNLYIFCADHNTKKNVYLSCAKVQSHSYDPESALSRFGQPEPCGEQGQFSSESNCLPLMWPRFRCLVQGFFFGFSGFLPFHKIQHL